MTNKLNIVLIGSLSISFYYNLDYAKQLSYGVTFAGILQLIFLSYVSLKYYKPNFSLNFKITKKSKILF